eukprot:CAMPEP_0172472624 /NCGR_PEP_ID=MMETSP1065-20121228/68433_1 /TAXON_ID=265537 /ORGANISM="Amphiprora paludosa, Strain CCMP125" /LENGTH=499 /DNA_ID=CAMNT_0013230773 /DNA_START=109 /DNA_END=1608 /DNA_ORIENTATION=+
MAVIRQRQRLALAACILGFASTATAFTSIDPRGSMLSSVERNTISTRHHALPPDQISTYTDLLNSVTHSSNLIADAAAAAGDAKELGWWGQYINLFKMTLNGVHSAVDGPLRSVGIDQTWGISIALFTIGVRSLLVPLSIQQSQSAEYMKALKPYIAEIKEKFKDNQDAQNKALGKLYEDADQNPLSGCFTSLAQLPIFLGLYRGIRLLASDGVLEEKFLWIPNLQGPVSPPNYNGLDWLTQGWVSTGEGLPTPPLGWETTLAFLVMPVILVVLQSITMNALQPPVDENATEEEKQTLESTQGVLKFLPLLIGFFSLQVPAGLTIYWLSSNLFTLTQSLAVKAYFAANPPEIELPEYWEQMSEGKAFDDMTPDERRKATEAGLRVGPSFDDLVTQSRFHVFVEREPFRETTDSWKRAEEMKSDIKLSADLEQWILSSGVTALGVEQEEKKDAPTNGASGEKEEEKKESSKKETVVAKKDDDEKLFFADKDTKEEAEIVA